ncbi:hypothetical protein [Nonomuraea dietziae]|uniref:hypothetical protein n=1 Tax=Nonomuraea dietziae TaxID=65515 RepID=UPI0033E4BA5C
MAVLATGASWLTAAPASAEICDEKVVLLDRTTVAGVCEETAGLRARATRTAMTAPRGSGLSMSAERLAKTAGLPGLSRTTAVLSLADTGGVAAGAGLPSLPSGVPGEKGIVEASKLSITPDLPGLPTLPSTEAVDDGFRLGELGGRAEVVQVAEVAEVNAPEVAEVNAPEVAMPDAAGVTGMTAPINLTPPINEVTARVGELVEKRGAQVLPPLSVTNGEGADGLAEELDLG